MFLILSLLFPRLYRISQAIPFHPDEDFLVSSSLNLEKNNFTLPNYPYGGLPFLVLFLTFKISELVAGFFSLVNSLNPYLHAKLLIVLVVTPMIAFEFCRCLRFLNTSKKTAFLITALFSINSFFVQHTRFFIVDPFLLLFTLATFRQSLKITHSFSLKNILALGFYFGLATSTKIFSLTFLIPIIFCGYFGIKNSQAKFQRLKCVAGTFIFVFTAALVYCICNPFIFKDFSRVIQSISFELKIVTGEIIMPFTMQFYNTNFLTSINNFLHITGLEIVVLAIFGFLTLLKARKLSLLIWFIAVTTPPLLSFAKHSRYLLPTVALSYIFVGLVFREIRSFWQKLALVALFFASFCRLASYLSPLTYEHPFLEISKKFFSSIQSATVSTTPWDHGLIIPEWRSGIIFIPLNFYGDCSEKHFNDLIDSINKVEFIVFITQRVPRSYAADPLACPKISSLLYRILFEHGTELFSYVIRSPSVLGFQYFNFCKDESLSVFDNPPALIFRRITTFYREQFQLVEEVLTMKKLCELYTRLSNRVQRDK